MELWEAVSEAQKISIHALREEGDVELWEAVSEAQKISIHALREEGDCCMSAV